MPTLSTLCCLLLSAVRATPTPPTVCARQITTGECLGQTVVICGVVSSTIRDQIDSRFNWIILRTRTGKVCASTYETSNSLVELQKLKDAEVLLKGRVCRYTSWRRFLGYQLNIAGDDGLRVLTLPPADPFRAPTLADESEPHRQRVNGTVRAVSADQFFLLTAEGRSIPVKPETADVLPRVGDTVAAVGFADADMSSFRLDEAVFRREPTMTPAEDPVRFVGVDRIIIRKKGTWHLNESAYGAICRLTGTVSRPGGEADLEGGPLPALNVGAASFRIDHTNLPEDVRRSLVDGCVAEITGLCHADFESDRSTIVFPRFQGFQLIPRTADDIRILRQPPWWTTARLLIVIGVLLAVLALLGGWAVALRVVSSRRARALAQEQIASARAELKVEERTRLAVELHDSLSQTLTGVALQVDAAMGAGANTNVAARFLSTARQMLASCRQELRCCLWDLRSRTFAEKDMTEAVRRTVAPHAGHVAVAVRFNVLRETLSETTTHAILRIVRELVVNAIRAVAAGGRVVSPEIQSAQAEQPEQTVLSDRQVQILRYAARGYSNREIGKVVHVGTDCVKAHLKTIFARLGVTSRTEAVATAFRKRLLRA